MLPILFHLILDRIKVTINLLRKSDLFRNHSSEEGLLLSKFKDLQIKFRCGNGDEGTLVAFVGLLCDILRAPHLSGPYKLSSLESIQAMIVNGILSNLSNKDEVCSQIVTCIVSCKFVQTDVTGDQLVQLHLLKTLHCLVAHEFSCFREETTWELLGLCLSVMESLGGGGMRKSLVRYRAAEEIVTFVTESVLASSSYTDECEPNQKSACLATFLRILQHTSATLIKGCARWEDSSQLLSVKEAQSQKGGTSAAGGGYAPNTVGSGSPFLVDVNLDAPSTHVVFCLRTLQTIMIGVNKHKALHVELFRSDELCAVLGEIGHSLLTLGRWFDLLPAAVFQSVLSVYVALFNAVGSHQKPVVEHFFKQVYIRGLGYSLNLLSDMVGKDFPLQGVLAPLSKAGADVPAGAESGGRIFDNVCCRVDYLELVLESLCDLIADDTFVPTLFATFDCGVRQIDLVQPCLQLLARSASIVVTAGLEKLGVAKELGVLIVQCYKQVLTTFVERKQREDAWFDAARKASAAHASEVQTAAAVFQASRRCKNLLADACVRFSNKPGDALKFLQQNGMISSPVSAATVANFLRYSPLLSKQAVGAFLGELGKQDPKTEWDSVAFHQQLLLCYVESFELSGKSVLDCMRIFLSAFRLPGEAQQIDRILVAFSEFCHKNCVEGREGILENPEVAYLLSFSIIMLNTDRHNPNIRSDRKMTLEQFVRNNTNYGKEVNQTKPLPREFLESIYSSISNRQIRTECDDPWAVVTDEEWMDLQMQSRASKWAGSLLFVPSLFIPSTSQAEDEGERNPDAVNEAVPLDLQDRVASQLFSSKHGLAKLIDATLSSAVLQDLVWLWDKDIVICCADLLLLPCIAVHIYNHRLVTSVLSSDHLGTHDAADTLQVNGWKERTGRLISLSGEFTTELLTLTTKHGVSRFVEQVVVLLEEAAGMHQSGLTQQFVSSLCTENYMSPEQVLPAPCWKVVAGQFSEQIAFPSSQKALLFMLEVVSTYSSSIRSWHSVLFCLSVLRDHILLPSEMVLDGDSDLLPPNVRNEFDTMLSQLDRTLDGSTDCKEAEVRKPATRGSFLSLHLLGEAIFGSAEPASQRDDRKDGIDEDKEMLALLVGRYSKRSSRWDAGYDALPAVSPKPLGDESAEVQLHSKRLVWDESLRASVAKSNLCTLIVDSKFLPEVVLQALMRSIARATEYYTLPEGCADSQLMVDFENLPPMEALLAEELSSLHAASTTTEFSKRLASALPEEGVCTSISASSMAWLEVVLVELALRNRDRFHICWPALRAHYLRSLGSSSFRLSYVSERQLTGVLKLVARMLSRDHYAGTMIELLAKILSPVVRTNADARRMESSDLSDSPSGPMTVTREGLLALSNQITAGMWRILTQNVDLLPLLSLEQWETVFRIVAFGSSSGSYAAFKSFEVMAWLLHEPRLIANVPVFCIIAVKPLVRNKSAPSFVATGAVRLLKYLHSRLEVPVLVGGSCVVADDVYAQALIQNAPSGIDEEGYDSVELDEDASVIWKKCWLPILQSLAEGVSDERVEVRDACALALCESIRDRHSGVVPNGILIDVLVHVLIPVIRVLGDLVVVDWHKKALSAPPPAAQQAWERDDKEWVSVDRPALPDRESALLHCIQTLTSVFVAHIKKLSSYPSFDKLWLQVLHILSYFVGTHHSADHSLANVRDSLSNRAFSDDQVALLESLSFVALGELEKLISLLQSEQIFRRRQGLLMVTRDYLQQVRQGDKLLVHLEGASEAT